MVCILATWLRPDLVTLALSTIIVLLLFHSTQLRSQSRHLVQARKKAQDERQLLIESIHCAPLAFAVYGPDDRLLAWNRRYERHYPVGFEKYYSQRNAKPPIYADLLAESVPEDIPADQVNSYIQERVDIQRQADGTPIDRYFPAVGWHRVTKFLTAHGAVAGFAVDISALKQKEAELQAEIQRRQSVEANLKHLATTDSLTGVLNRRSFMEHVSTQLLRYERDGTPASIILLDIDWFKSINDRFGHQTGDDVIVGVVNAATREIREGTDQIGRLGGEEFGILLPDTELDAAQACAERIREQVSSSRFGAGDNNQISCTASFGVSATNPHNLRLATIIGEADQAMYESKANGRNRVSGFSGQHKTTQQH